MCCNRGSGAGKGESKSAGVGKEGESVSGKRSAGGKGGSREKVLEVVKKVTEMAVPVRVKVEVAMLEKVNA